MKTILHASMLLSLTCAVIFAESPTPQSPKPNPEKKFQEMDKNGDSKISQEEFFLMPRLSRILEQKRAEVFKKLDQDQDGMLAETELSNHRQKMKEEVRSKLQKLDLDHSESLSFDEFKQGERAKDLPEERQKKLFSTLDKDGNGEINKADHLIKNP